MLYVYGVGEIPISISGDTTKSDTLVHTTRAAGVVTRALRRLKPGDSLGVRGPFGVGWPVEEAVGRDVVIIAGGIGLAPLRPLIYQVLSNRKKYGNCVLLYGARTPEDLLYQKELKTWGENFEVHVTVDRASGRWPGNVGVVSLLISKAGFDPVNCTVMVCGPEIMMRFTVQALLKRGVPASSIYLSMERNMKCAVGFCGHCQFGPFFVCKDGPVFAYHKMEWIFGKKEV